MDFLLECIGFPPDQDPEELIEHVRTHGEPVPWRGDPENHLCLPLGSGLELRLDREPGQDFWTILPHYRVPHRLRVAIENIQTIPDSPFDALVTGWASPPTPADIEEMGITDPGAYRLSFWLTDARRLPRRLPKGHVLAISVAGFALEVSYVGPNAGVKDQRILNERRGALITPLGGADSPGGCSEVSLRVKELRRLRNPITGNSVELVIADSPERPLMLFLSPWQLRSDGLPAPRPGWRIEGTFMFTGRVAGGLTGPQRKTRSSFG